MKQKKPRLLDLFCGAGGAAMGYARAGFEVVGVDSRPQPHYPFTFVQDDALTVALDGFDAYHASPPCQLYSITNRIWKKAHPDLVAVVRQRLVRTGKPYVLENVPGAPLPSSVVVCGTMFGLGVLRHRLFESNVLLFAPGSCRHQGSVKTGEYVSVFGGGGNGYTKARGSQAMGIEWMTMRELSQAIPPAYTEWFGRQLMEVL